MKDIKIIATGEKALNEMFKQILYPYRKTKYKTTRRVSFRNGIQVEFKLPD